MMRFALVFLLLTLATSMLSTAHAQIDPSSALLLNTDRTDVRESGIDTGRYTVKPRADHKPRARSTPAPSSSPSPSPESVATPVQNPNPNPTPTPTPTPIPTTGSTPESTAQSAPQLPSGPQSPTFEARPDSDEDVLPTPSATPIDERRQTLLELSFAPGYMYNDSKSTFAPRNYSVNAPTALIDATIWTSPTFGVHTGFMSTLNASVSDSLDNTANANVSEQWFVAGVRARTFFGTSRKAPTMTFGLDYREFEFRTPSDSNLRNKLTTSGLALTLDAEMPTGRLGAWQLGGAFGPALSHRESSNLTDFRSGESPKTTSVEVHLGARYRFDHADQIFWKISYGVEKDLFEGVTTINDPITGLPQSNVSVTNSFSMFQLGYTWGN